MLSPIHEFYHSISEAQNAYLSDSAQGNYEIIQEYGNSMDKGSVFRCYMRKAFENIATLDGWQIKHDPYYPSPRKGDVRRLLSHKSMPNIEFILLKKSSPQTSYYHQACLKNTNPSQLTLFSSEATLSLHPVLICVHVQLHQRPLFWAWDNQGKKHSLSIPEVCNIAEEPTKPIEPELILKPMIETLDIKFS